MHIRGSVSWDIRRGVDHGLARALYVRDAVGLAPYVAVLPDIPSMHPAVTRTQQAVDLRSAVQQWPQWWDRELARREQPPDSPPRPEEANIDDLPTVQGLAEVLHRDFWAWRNTVTRAEADRATSEDPVHLVGLVNSFERRLCRPVRPFRLNLREVPVLEPLGWVLDEESVLVTTGLTNDPRATEEFLEPVIAALA